MPIHWKFYKRMKLRFLISILIIAFSANSSFSQKLGFKAGIFAGLVPSQVDGDSYAGYHKIGLQGGLFLKYNFRRDMYFFTELKYIQKGAKQVSKDNLFYYKSVLNYFEFPVAVHYIWKKYFFEVGTAVSYLLSWYENFGASNVQISPGFKKIEWSGFVGVGINLTERIFILNRFSYSILPIRMYPEYIQTIRDRGWNNNNFQLGLYYKF